MAPSRSTSSRLSAEVQLALADTEKRITIQTQETERKVSAAIQAVKEDVIRDHSETGQNTKGIEKLELKVGILSDQVRALWWKMGLIVGAASGMSWAITHLTK